MEDADLDGVASRGRGLFGGGCGCFGSRRFSRWCGSRGTGIHEQGKD
jgi:hypothetical protein